MALKRSGRVSFGAALAVLVALVALALFSRVDAQNSVGSLAELRDRVDSARDAVCDESMEESMKSLCTNLLIQEGAVAADVKRFLRQAQVRQAQLRQAILWRGRS